MWDWRELRWLNIFGWWPRAAKTRKGQLFCRYFGIALFVFDFSQLIPEYLGLYKLIHEGRLKGMIVSLNTSLVGSLCAAKVFTIVTKSKQISFIVDSLDELDKSSMPKFLGTQGKKIMENAERHCRFIIFFLGAGLTTTLHWTLRPFGIVYFYNSKTTIMDAWVPWSYDNWTGWIAIYLIQFIHVFSAAYGLIMFDVHIFRVSEMIIAELTSLNLALTKIDFSRPKSNCEIVAGNEDTDKFTIYTSIQIHEKLLRLVTVFTDVTDLIQIIQFFLITGIFCLSIFEASSMQGVTQEKVVSLLEMVASMSTLMFMYCYYSTLIADQINEIGTSCYMNNWYEASLKEQKYLLTMMERSKKKPIFGKFVEIDLNTFVTVMKTAFSYYNVLQAFEIR